MILWILLGIVVVVVLAVIMMYNSLVRLKNQVQEAWSGIDVQLKRRYNLIPNLIATVKGYQQHEADTLEKVTELRNNAMAANSVKDKAQAESALSMGLGRLLAVAENYPDLKASANFLQLQQELADIEDHIQNARRYYNGATRDYNTTIQSFPSNMVANWFHFTARDFFELDSAAEKAVPKVDFSA